MKFTIYQESRPGKRPTNEDRIAHCYSRDALLTVVADGMGGHAHGEVAAQIAVETLTAAFQQAAQPDIDDPFLFLQQGLFLAHRAILEKTAGHPIDNSPRTTCVACLVQHNVAYWAHAGDSRLYLMRGGRLIAQTRDHSRVQMLLDEGRITPSQAAIHPDRNRVYSCLGGPQRPEIALSRKTPLEAGDVIALCTDGVSGVLSGEVLAVALRNANLMQMVTLLMNQAEIRGGEHGDNLSMIAVRWETGYVEGTAGEVSTQLMAPDEVTTRFGESARQPGDRTDLSEEEIERAIAEIRATIQKYSK